MIPTYGAMDGSDLPGLWVICRSDFSPSKVDLLLQQ